MKAASTKTLQFIPVIVLKIIFKMAYRKRYTLNAWSGHLDSGRLET